MSTCPYCGLKIKNNTCDFCGGPVRGASINIGLGPIMYKAALDKVRETIGADGCHKVVETAYIAYGEYNQGMGERGKLDIYFEEKMRERCPDLLKELEEKTYFDRLEMGILAFALKMHDRGVTPDKFSKN